MLGFSAKLNIVDLRILRGDFSRKDATAQRKPFRNAAALCAVAPLRETLSRLRKAIGHHILWRRVLENRMALVFEPRMTSELAVVLISHAKDDARRYAAT